MFQILEWSGTRDLPRIIIDNCHEVQLLSNTRSAEGVVMNLEENDGESLRTSLRGHLSDVADLLSLLELILARLEEHDRLLD